ncbi:MAG TPA: glycosyltransferase [Burkholderiales bacterium]|nr:glycosyltransferase [Burkholderiales bacterium]
MNDPAVSVVVPTCGRPELLGRCLAALERQTLDRARFEIVVVEDKLREGPAVARNRGWRLARAPIVAFTDDDTEPDPDWLRYGLAAFEVGVEAVCGRVRMPIPERPTDYERDAQGLERAEFVTANCFIRKSTLERVGGFDERFRLAWREDSDLHFKLLRSGARIVREPRALVVHPVRPAQWGVSLRQQKKVMYDALLFKKHPQLYRSRIRSSPRWDYYLTVGSLLLAVIQPWALLVWLFLTAKLFVKRLEGASLHPRHVAEMLVTSAAIPLLSVFWRLVGSVRFRVPFA